MIKCQTITDILIAPIRVRNFNDVLLLNHKSALEQLIHRDRNHASVIMWSVANEPRTTTEKSGVYFQ